MGQRAIGIAAGDQLLRQRQRRIRR